MYLGPCPGNVGPGASFDAARRETQWDLGDAIGIAARAFVEGLFGVQPDALTGELRVRPGFPADWDHATLRHPDFKIAFRREGLTETYVVESSFPKPMALRLEAAALRAGISRIQVNGRPAQWRALEDSVGSPRVEIRSEPAPKFEVVIVWRGAKPAEPAASEPTAS